MIPPDVVLPGGSIVPGESLGPCGQCGEMTFDVMHRWVQVKDPQDNPVEMELITAQCPHCCWVRDGRNHHGRRERRVLLGRLDNATGVITLEPAS